MDGTVEKITINYIYVILTPRGNNRAMRNLHEIRLILRTGLLLLIIMRVKKIELQKYVLFVLL